MEEEYRPNLEIGDGDSNSENYDSVIDDSELQSLRDKTFTPEFTELVSRITGHTEKGKDIFDLSRDELLKKYHTLFYCASNLLELDTINSSFNHFNFHEDILFDSVSDHVTGVMEKSGFPSFSFLSFDFSLRAYTPVLLTIEGVQQSDIVFDVHENLIKKITSVKHGIVIGRDEIEADHYLRKRMECVNDNPDCAFFFCSVKNIARHIIHTPELVGITDMEGYSSILMISLGDSPEIPEIYNVFDILAKELSLHLMLLESMAMKRQAAYSVDSPGRTLAVIDYLEAVYSGMGNGNVYLLRCMQCGNREVYYAFRYLQEKIRDMISGSSVFMRITVDITLLFLSLNDIDKVHNVCENHNTIFPDSAIFRECDINKLFHFGIV